MLESWLLGRPTTCRVAPHFWRPISSGEESGVSPSAVVFCSVGESVTVPRVELEYEEFVEGVGDGSLRLSLAPLPPPPPPRRFFIGVVSFSFRRLAIKCGRDFFANDAFCDALGDPPTPPSSCSAARPSVSPSSKRASAAARSASEMSTAAALSFFCFAAALDFAVTVGGAPRRIFRGCSDAFRSDASEVSISPSSISRSKKRRARFLICVALLRARFSS